MRRLVRHRGVPIVTLLVAGMAIGLWLGNDYGTTYDEELNAANGAAALRAFGGSEDYFQLPALPDHGPFYFMVMALGSQLVHQLAPDWTLSDGRHLTHFFLFLGSVACFYLLCRRLSGRTPALMASLLFATQPLLLGHGFINQKDTPFMALFLATFVTGILAVDHLTGSTPSHRPAQPADPLISRQGKSAQLSAQWRTLGIPARLLYCIIVALCLLLAFDFAWIGALRQSGLELVKAAHAGQAPGVAQRIFDVFATDVHKTPLTYYIAQLESHYDGMRYPLAVAAALAALFASSAALPRFRELWGLNRSALTTAGWWASAALLGATICVRQQGIFVGGLVSLYLLYKARARAGFPLVVYWTTAAIVTYITWPYLWPAPVERFIGSLSWAATFPSYDTFFEGRWISAETRPWYYLPKLVGLQLTEPAIAMVLIGAGLALHRLRREPRDWFLYLLLALWIGAPAFGVMVLEMTVYGNIRHLLFILPALLAFSVVTFDWLRTRLGREPVLWAAVALSIIPGIMAVIYLHPFEYIYLNSFTGGVSGGYGWYELDHECISLRQGIETANRLVPPEATVMVPRQVGSVRQYARPDIRLVGRTSAPKNVDYVLTCTWPSTVDLSNQGFAPIFSVQRGNAVLATLWEK